MASSRDAAPPDAVSSSGAFSSGTFTNDISPDDVTLDDIRAAAERIRGLALRTPLVRLPLPGTDAPETAVYAKCENLQRTGSFKLRGAGNFLAAMTPGARARGVVAHSSGNHAQGVAYAARSFGAPAAIAIPRGAPRVKVERTAALGAEVVRCGPSADEREAAAVVFVEREGRTLVPPYDHPLIVAGQGTAGLEIVEELPDVANVLVCLGGGGLTAGIATALAALRPDARVIGVEPELAADGAESFARGERVAWSAERTTRTVADGVRTQALGRLTFAIVRERAAGVATVREDEILDAARWYARDAHLVVEPTGALTLAAWRRAQRGDAEGAGELELRPGPTVLLVSGGNVDPERLADIVRG